MGNGQDATNGEKQEIALLLIEGMSILEISKEIHRNHWMVKKAVEKITKFRNRSKGKGFMKFPLQGECKLKCLIVKQPLLTNAQIFERTGIEESISDKRCRILWKLGSLKKYHMHHNLGGANI